MTPQKLVISNSWGKKVAATEKWLLLKNYGDVLPELQREFASALF